MVLSNVMRKVSRSVGVAEAVDEVSGNGTAPSSEPDAGPPRQLLKGLSIFNENGRIAMVKQVGDAFGHVHGVQRNLPPRHC